MRSLPRPGALLAAMAAPILIGCGGDPSGPDTPPPPSVPVEARPATVEISTGNNQATAPGTAVAVAPTVVVKDSTGKGVAGVPVAFTIEAGGGAMATDTVLSDATGLAASAWRLGPMPAENRMKATVAGIAPVHFTASGRYLVPTTPVSGLVMLPSGASLAPASLRLETGIADVPVGADGSFLASALPGGVQLAAAHAPNGSPVLMGWFDGPHHALTARTTAEVLAYFDLGGYQMPEAALRDSVRSYLSLEDLEPLVSAISTMLHGSAAAATLAAPAIIQARVALLQRLRSAGSLPRGIIIDPSGQEQSGVFVDQVGLNNVTITNHRRRRISAFVDRVSYVPQGLSGSIPSPVAGQPIPLAAVTAATSVIGTGINLLFGNSAWTPVVSAPQPVPLAPANAVSTHYRVTVVGPGSPNPNVPLTIEQRAEQRRTSFETMVLEALLPLLDQLLQADNALQSHGTGTDVSSLVSQFVDVLPSGVLESAASGDMQGALQGAWTLLQDSGPGQELLLNVFMTTIAANGVPKDVILAKAKEWTKVLTIVEAIATAGDLFYVVKHSATAYDAETWEVNVGQAQVRLDPPASLISNLDLQVLHAVVLEATGGGPAPVFHYRWSTTGTVGQICAQFAGCSTSIPSSSRDVVSYFPDSNKEGTDQVTVVVFIVENGKEEVIGDATATITTVAPKVDIAPQQSSIDYNQTVQLSAIVDSRLLDGGTLTYDWNTAGALGTFLLGQTSAQTSLPSINYVSNRQIEGTETVTVTVTSTKNGVTRNLGSATATILVEHQRPTIVMGTWGISPSVSLANGRECVEAYISFPVIADARSYSVHAYGFNDTATGQNNLTFPVVPPLPIQAGCSDLGWGHDGSTGQEYIHMLSGFAGPANSISGAIASFTSRFAGMIVEVTVSY